MKQSIILIIFLVIITTIIVVIKPEAIKEVRIINQVYELKQQEVVDNSRVSANIQHQKVVETENIQVKPKEVPTQVQKIEVKQQPVNTSSQSVKLETVRTVPKKTNTKITNQKINTTPVVVKPAEKKAEKNPIAVTPKENKPAQVVQPKVTPQVAPQNNPPQQNTIKQQKSAEEISWNRWLANVHNQIISQVNLPVVPEGTVFNYSFTVSADGTITNVRASSVTPQYTAYAIQYISPVVRKNAHAAFLKFPEGTERKSMDVQYKFKTNVSGAINQASPSNFNNVETINR